VKEIDVPGSPHTPLIRTKITVPPLRTRIVAPAAVRTARCRDAATGHTDLRSDGFRQDHAGHRLAQEAQGISL